MTPAGRRAAWAVTGLLVLAVEIGIYIVTVGPVLPFSVDQAIGFGDQLDETTVDVWYDCIAGPSDVDVLEESDQIIVRIRARSHSGDCASGYTLRLHEALGARPLIDASTGERVEVRNRSMPERP